MGSVTRGCLALSALIDPLGYNSLMTADIQAPEHESGYVELFNNGTQYYLAARFGAVAGINPIPGFVI